MKGGPVVSIIGAGFAVFLFVGAFVDIAERLFRASDLRGALARATGLPRSVWGTALAHAGVAVTILGLSASGWGIERVASVAVKQSLPLGPWTVQFGAPEQRQGPNYSAFVVPTRVLDSAGREVARIEPARRSFATRKMTTTEAGIATLGLGQVYIAITDDTAGRIDARMYWKPLVTLIWIGALIMAFGGLVSLSDRRVRVGVAQRRRSLLPASGEKVARSAG